ncbi:MAG TPA: type II toxin-antitoxin system VapC family toxin [Solirubrobacterales bacterium]|nr:type II toxin-antitoxin system VapC family toxin [Solirubrobacterales bacterium]
MIVLDASVLAPALADDGEDGDRVRERLRDEALAAPELIDLEVVSVLRRAVRARNLDERRSGQALTDLATMPLRRVPHLRLLPRIWELRDNLTAYDASYVALAETLGAPLLTADGPLAAAPGIRCEVEVLR